LSLPDVVHRFKSLTTSRYGDGVRNAGWTPYEGRLWQRNYFERVIRNERELDGLRAYIEANPLRWNEDKLNPAFITVG
jgi:REP element-mobilizing transposase RayT